MPDIEHASLGSSDCHEPKHISNSNTSDAGKVITPSRTSNGVSELRYLRAEDVRGLPDFRKAYVDLVGTGNSSTVPEASGSSKEITSLFNNSSVSSNFSLTNTGLEFNLEGIYKVSAAFRVATSSGPVEFYYSLEDEEMQFLGSADNNGLVTAEFLISANSNSSMKLFAKSAGTSSNTITISQNIVIVRI